MKASYIFVVVTATLSLLTGSAQGQVSDTFQSYADDAALTTVWPRASGTAASIFLAPDPANAANQTIEQTTAAGRLRYTLASGLTPSDANPLAFSFDFYDPLGAVGTSGRIYGEVRNSAAATGLLAAGVYNSANTGVYDVNKYQARNADNGGWVQLEVDRSVGWHNFRFEISGNSANLFVDNVLQTSFTDRSLTGGVAYDWIHVGSGLTGSTPGYFDNVSLSAIPEPSTVALLMLGGAVLVYGRFRRR